MAFARARVLRTLQSSLRYSGQRVVPRVSAPARNQLVQRRYASGGGGAHGEHQSSSDIPWAIGAVIVTIPSCWYLWPSSSHADAGHHGGHDEHEEHSEEGEEKQEDAPQEEESPKEDEANTEGDSKEDKEADKEFEEKEEKEQDAEPTKASGDAQDSLPPGGDDSETSQGGGSETSHSNEGKDDSGESEGGSEGASEGEEGQGSGVGTNFRQNYGGSESVKRNKELGSGKHMAEGQTAAKHSIPIQDDPSKSKKGEGRPETTKTTGTVDPGRPQK